ncbi:MAG: nicotinate-nucleotide adenylyltransferase [Euzebyales bacterium]|jgi:nicotinate-nucleotide adenylyltransferase|nr:nicotinate-nucleotide adenylyltransferase [Euzebyales bacterium]
MSAPRRVGIMGGTFDPIHLGHLVTAEQARADLGLDEVVFIPAGQPWQKSRDVTGSEHRYLMTVLATAANPAFSVSRLEIDKPGATYTVDTLRDLRAALPADDLFFITGADAILSILTWKDAQECLMLADFVAATRPGHDLSALDHEGLRDEVTVLDVPALAISSTDVRERFAVGRSATYLIPREVEEYARKHGLYGMKGHGLAGMAGERSHNSELPA